MLEQKLDPNNTETHFYVLKKSGEIAAFLRFDHRDDLEPGAYYGGSFNMRPDLRGSAIGEVFMQRTLQKEAERHVVYANVVPDAVVGARYVEDGFVIRGIDVVEEGGMVTEDLSIRLDKAFNARAKAKQPGVSFAHLLAGVDGVRVERFTYPEEKATFLSRIRECTAEGEVVTRYWIDPVHPETRFLAFEAVEEPAS